MNPAGDVANEIASAVVHEGIETTEFASKGAVSIMAYLLSLVQTHKLTRSGKVNIKHFDDRPSSVFIMKGSDIEKFQQEAKARNVTYSIVAQNYSSDEFVDVIVSAETAQRVEYIIDRFGLDAKHADELRRQNDEPEISSNGEKESDSMMARSESPSAPISERDEKNENSIDERPSLKNAVIPEIKKNRNLSKNTPKVPKVKGDR